MSIDLNAIQARAQIIQRCMDARPNDCYDMSDIGGALDDASDDVPALLAYARDLEARIGRVEAAASRNALMDIIADAYGDKNHGHLSLAAADSIRAALTATEES